MNPMNLQARLKLARKRRGYSSAVGLAKAADVSVSSITNIESGARIGHKTLVTLAETLRVPLPWLLRGEGEEPNWYGPSSGASPAASPGAESLPQDAMSIARHYDAVRDPATRRVLFSTIMNAIMLTMHTPEDSAPPGATPAFQDGLSERRNAKLR